ncbi:MAG: hypothetical protein WBK77_07320 [Alphaproteobacteria bacterium]
MEKLAVTVHLDPLLPMFWFGLVAGVAVMALAFAAWKNRGSILLRGILTSAFIIALLNPSLIEEKRDAVKDVAFAVVDLSPSQNLGTRSERTKAALNALTEDAKKHPNLELRIIESSGDTNLSRETRLFDDLDKAVADVPISRRAGAIFLTDGQIHDSPQTGTQYGPISAWLSGEKNEKDRRIVITTAPSYGIVGQTASVKYKIEDTNNFDTNYATVTINRYGQTPEVIAVETGVEQTATLDIEHAGQNVFEISIQAEDNELTPLNNRAALIINGVRDRMRVLLVSGQPHAGGRTWRDLLTSDPGVDLVHFTILRDPEKIDMTPPNEMSLIAFPFHELFETKLYDFDLIIFDQYKLNRILPDYYFENIVKYVQQGGALLEASGPSFATEDSVYNTDLSSILPAASTGTIIRKAFKPALTEDGQKHPVTSDLEGPGSDPKNPHWSHWLRQVVVTRKSGDILMTGADGHPLLILDRVGKGRVAQLASDHIWLWSRGYGDGGPHAEFLRRIIHWAMKEPELDEKALSAEIYGDLITLHSRNHKMENKNVKMTKPDGTQEDIAFEISTDGTLKASIKTDQLGIYGFEDSEGQKTYIVSGDLNPPELSAVVTSADKIEPLAKETGGSILWMNDTPRPALKFSSTPRYFGGKNDIPLRRNNAFDVRGVEEKPVLPPPALALFLLLMVAFVWWREGRSV